jgi:predicted lysophospholipase L1 biosynthesis ABC-type transport system permease subunit
MVEGRDFTDRDDADAPPVVIVNQAFARRYFGGANPVGRSIRAWGTTLTVVGMVKDVEFHNLSEAPPPYFYAPFRQYFRTGHTAVFYVRTAGDPVALAKVLRREAAAIDPNVFVHEAMPLAEYTTATLYPLKVAASLLAVLGALSVLLAAVGLYSVMAYAVVQRTHEVGIRMALGAQPRSVLNLVMRQGLVLTGAGLLIGIPAALAAAHFAGGMLTAVGVADPGTFAAAAVFLALVAVAASWFPARRATRLDPMAALRCE